MPITTFQGVIAEQSTLLVNARELHTRLQVGRDFSNWIKSRIEDYGFIENEDFIRSPKLASGKLKEFSGVFAKFGENLGGRPKVEYHITLDMAKELCMLERSELGQQARRYFIRMEKEALAQKQASLPAPTPSPVIHADYISLSKDRYIALLERLVDMNGGGQLPKPIRRTTRPLTPQEKQQILSMHGEGFSHEQIGNFINRSKSAVRAVIREAL